MLGATTIGNATLIVYDGKPILATDPWFGDDDPAYFGSWGLSHIIPKDCRHDIINAKHIWFSHGHPDHLNRASLERIRGKHILLPDHVGLRIFSDLREMGFDVAILPDRRWINLSSRVNVCSITTVIQDAILLVDINGRLFINLNDSWARNCIKFIRNISKKYRRSYLLSASGYGDADMINMFDENGVFVEPWASTKPPVGRALSDLAKRLGARGVVPFSSFHRYQRTDSIWAQKYVTPLEAYHQGFDDRELQFVPAFSHIDCASDDWTGLEPSIRSGDFRPPSDYGDNWSDLLGKTDFILLKAYFMKKELVKKYVSFINFRVGGSDNIIHFDGKDDKGITFEVPRYILMQAIKNEAFDDLLIGNFMKTTLHNMKTLYDGEFNFAVTKYGDNGRAQSYSEVKEYIRKYRHRAGVDWYDKEKLEHAIRVAASYIPSNSALYKLGRLIYRSVC
jgi:hypothetical protein